MNTFKYVFGPVPSRRLGRSLGISPIPNKTCNYSCIYCQLGRTNKMTNIRKEYFPLKDILSEFEAYLKDSDQFDVVSIVGEGEPTLYSRLGELIHELKVLTDKPVAVITNSALLSDPAVREELYEADIVLPSMDSCDADTYRKIDRPYGRLKFEDTYEGLITFSKNFKGQLFLEVMLMDGINDDPESLMRFKELFKAIRYEKLYINTPVRPPAESYAKISSPEAIQNAVDILGGISIDALANGGFFSEIADDYEAILSIIGRHPMNQHEVRGFLDSRGNSDPDAIFDRLANDDAVILTEYKGYFTYRRK